MNDDRKANLLGEDVQILMCFIKMLWHQWRCQCHFESLHIYMTHKSAQKVIIFNCLFTRFVHAASSVFILRGSAA